MNLDEATILLNSAERHELRDHAFGDLEMHWTKDGVVVAEGYFGGTEGSIWFTDNTTFAGQEARNLRLFGKLAEVTRNDSTGPDEFKLGETMPGLTKQGVKEELTGVHYNIFEQNEGNNA